MKTAVILLGNVRTWDICSDSFRNKFKDVDVFINTYDAQYMLAPYIQGLTNFYDETILDNEAILKMFEGINVKHINIEKSEDAKKKVEHDKLHFKLSFEPYDITGIYGQYLKLKESVDIIKDYEKQNGFTYDYIIKTRFDIIYNDFDFLYDNSSVLINIGYAKPNDHFIMCNRKSFEGITTFIHEEFFNATCPGSNLQPPHGLLWNAIQNQRLQIIERPIVKHLERPNIGAHTIY